jgi:hypothetical protein
MDNRTYYSKRHFRRHSKGATHTAFQGVSYKHIQNLLFVKNHVPAAERFDKLATKGKPLKREMPTTTNKHPTKNNQQNEAKR